MTSEVTQLTKEEMRNRYKAAMLLGGAADAIGFYKGTWEFEISGDKIHQEVKKMGGIGALNVKKPQWIVSDDTVMHLATAEAIIEYGKSRSGDIKKLYQMVAKHYHVSMHDMNGRSPGITCTHGVSQLKPNRPDGYMIPFNDKGGGCGGAMRSMCIGMYYPKPEQIDSLVALSIECGRMTHNHPTGYLGSLASALFTHYAVQGKPAHCWGAGLMETLELAWEYVKKEGRDVDKNQLHWNYFKNAWADYLKVRGLTDGKSPPKFPDVYGVLERDKFYKKVSYSGWGGSSGHDAPMIAYDAFLGSGDSWEELSNRAFFHGGDSDSTAIIAATWFGILYGTKGVPPGNYQNLEYKDRLEEAGSKIFDLVEHLFS